MNLYNIFAKQVMLPFSDYYTGWGISKALKFLDESQWWPQEKIIEYQSERLRKIVKHSYNNVEYYKNLFDKHGITYNQIQDISDLKKIPVLTKDELIKNFPYRLTAKNIDKSKMIHLHSSGSTGKRVNLYIDNIAYGFNIACNLRGWMWMGYSIGDRFVKISQNRRNSFVKKLQDRIDRSVLFTQKYDRLGFEEFLRLLNSYNPQFIRSYPDPLIFICQYLQENKINLKDKAIKGINTTGNILFPWARDIIKSNFDVDVFDSYSTEGTATLFECPTHECYHLSMEYGVYELLDNDENEVAEGNEGKLFATDLFNYATPFLRYDTQDILIKSQKKCNCGRNLSCFDKIIGRDNDVLKTSKGQYLIAQTFTTYFKYFPSILHFQVEQTEQNEFVFHLVINDLFTAEVEKQIVDYWTAYIDEYAKILINIVEEIPLLPSGKRRFLIRNSKIEI